MNEPSLQAATDAARTRHGFRTLAETARLAERGVTLFDPASTLVARAADIAAGVVLWPGVLVQCADGGAIAIAAGAVLWSGTRLSAEAGSAIAIGPETAIGEEGGFTILAGAGHRIAIAANARLRGGGTLEGDCEIGEGGQIIGPIRARDIRLGAGGSWREPDPDRRGGVLKGAGVARGIHVPTGFTLQGFGIFDPSDLKPQSVFHPKG